MLVLQEHNIKNITLKTASKTSPQVHLKILTCLTGRNLKCLIQKIKNKVLDIILVGIINRPPKILALLSSNYMSTDEKSPKT